jgi:hypothetical protein
MSRLCPICEQPLLTPETVYCSPICQQIDERAYARCQALLQLKSRLAPMAFTALLQEPIVRDYLRQIVWQQGALEFMVCEDYTFASVEYRRVMLLPDQPIVPLYPPSPEWYAVFWDYELLFMPLDVVVDTVCAENTANVWLLEQLAQHEECWMLACVAKNPHTPTALLALLQAKTQPMLQGYLQRITYRFSKYTLLDSHPIDFGPKPHLQVRQALAQHPNANAELLTLLAQDDDDLIRQFVARHPYTDHATLRQLAQDANRFVRKLAQQRLTREEGV